MPWRLCASAVDELEPVIRPILLAFVVWPAVAFAQEVTQPPPGPRVENARFLMQLDPHTPEQMAAFYEARGFPPAALDVIRHACFITVRIENRGPEVIWLEPGRWRIETARGPVERLGRDYWRQQWERLNVPPGARATFGWTLLPEQRDLRPSEPVGGNITLRWTDEPLTLTAWFDTRRDRRGNPIRVQFRNLRCPRDEATP